MKFEMVMAEIRRRSQSPGALQASASIIMALRNRAVRALLDKLAQLTTSCGQVSTLAFHLGQVDARHLIDLAFCNSLESAV